MTPSLRDHINKKELPKFILECTGSCKDFYILKIFWQLISEITTNKIFTAEKYILFLFIITTAKRLYKISEQN